MFGHHHHGRRCGHAHHADAEIWAIRGGGSGRGFGGGGPRGGRGFGGGDGPIGRFLFRGDLRLVILALVENEARHGYDLIKQIEEMTGGFYAPSPGVVYPTLTYLEEAGYVRVEEEGNKKLYAITAEGKTYLDENRAMVGKIFDKLDSIGEKLRRRRERHDGHEGHEGRAAERGPDLPASIDAAFLNLRETIARKLEADDAKPGEIVRFLLGVADDLDAGEKKAE